MYSSTYSYQKMAALEQNVMINSLRDMNVYFCNSSLFPNQLSSFIRKPIKKWVKYKRKCLQNLKQRCSLLPTHHTKLTLIWKTPLGAIDSKARCHLEHLFSLAVPREVDEKRTLRYCGHSDSETMVAAGPDPATARGNQEHCVPSQCLCQPLSIQAVIRVKSN